MNLKIFACSFQKKKFFQVHLNSCYRFIATSSVTLVKYLWLKKYQCDVGRLLRPAFLESYHIFNQVKNTILLSDCQVTKKELNQACGSIYDLVLQMKQWPLHYQQTCSGQLCTSLITFTKYQHRQPKLYSIMCALRECTRTKFIGQLLVGTLISISHLAVGLSFVGQFLVLPPTDGCLFSGCLSFGWLASGDGP